MNITEYISSKGGTGTIDCPVIAQLALDAECAAGTLYMIHKGHKNAGPKLAVRIERATAGQVTRSELRDDLFGNGADAEPNPLEVASS